MDASFAPDRKWFVFDSETSQTLAKGFANKRAALSWMAQKLGLIPTPDRRQRPAFKLRMAH